MLGDAVVEHALAEIVPVFWALKAVASSLKYWISVCPAPGPRRGSWPCLRRSGGGGTSDRLGPAAEAFGEEILGHRVEGDVVLRPGEAVALVGKTT
jgi:hypothetical protein